MMEELDQSDEAEAPAVSRVPRAVWINRPRTRVADTTGVARGAATALVTAGLLAMAIASLAGHVPATPQPAAGYLPAQIAPGALRSPEEQPSTF